MRLALSALVLTLTSASAQQLRIAADFEHEGERFKSSCLKLNSFGAVGGCAQVLFTDHPLHIAIGSLAPGNGFAAGPAFVSHWTPKNWRINLDGDAVFTSNGSWRSGAYLTAFRNRRRTITTTEGGTGTTPTGTQAFEVPTFRAYVQNISLTRVAYYGLGQDTQRRNKSFFGEREAIVGGNVVWPLGTPLNLSLFGEVNGRFVNIRSRTGQSSPSIEQLYTEATAPGLRRQPATAQFGQGVRLRPSLARGYVRLNYSVTYQQFVATDSHFSFQRLVTDLGHEFPLYRRTRSSLARLHNGPNDCSVSPTPPYSCPGVSRNLEGSFGFRLFMTHSYVGQSGAVPFYFAPTLGGSDINGTPALSSYDDYRFRGPNAILLRGTFEHSIYKWPIGITFMVDEGKVAARPGDLDFGHLAHSYAAGLTLRAGGFPLVYLLFAWGGQESHHNIFRMDTSLLGGAARPSLY